MASEGSHSSTISNKAKSPLCNQEDDSDLPRPPKFCCDCHMKTFTTLELWLIWIFTLPLFPLMLFFTLVIAFQPLEYSIFTRTSFFLGCLLSGIFTICIFGLFIEKGMYVVNLG
ncbi:Hypothetical protein GLP15_637 [Giardia lamblia P15]|uniref:Uncharacterized protein n=1 Tax=Giardia intestinalis (strain P15) TaxID=658858 RepID=E1F5A3_GIAIA|nr:Hypothetical protein GLP15_637 [Giardia lamblia P15]